MQLSQHVFASLSSKLCVLLLALALISIFSDVVFSVLLFFFLVHAVIAILVMCVPFLRMIFSLGWGWEQDIRPYCDLKSLSFSWFSYT